MAKTKADVVTEVEDVEDETVEEVEEEGPRIVQYHGREFELEQPSTDVVLRILNCLATLGVRGEAAAVRAMRKPTVIGTLFGLLAVLSKNDLARLGSAVFQFKDDGKGRKWIKGLDNPKVAPLIDALFINISLSDDLAESLASFFGGVDLLVDWVNRLSPKVGGLANLLQQATTQSEES